MKAQRQSALRNAVCEWCSTPFEYKYSGKPQRFCGAHCAGKHNAQPRITHNLSDSPEFQCWMDMKRRCHNPKYKPFKNYGARGIIVCDRWRNSFANFIADMGRRPDGHSIERKDNEGNYEPGNCMWMPRRLQNRNQRRTKLTEEKAAAIRGLLTGGSRVCEIVKSQGVPRNTVNRILYRHHWDVPSAA